MGFKGWEVSAQAEITALGVASVHASAAIGNDPVLLVV